MRSSRTRGFDARTAALAATLLLGACGSSTTPATAFRADPDALKRGKALFVGTCAGYCHSPAVERAAPYLFDCTWVNGSGTDQEVFDLIADGVPSTAMLGFRGKLPEGDADIWRLVAYITTSGPGC